MTPIWSGRLSPQLDRLSLVEIGDFRMATSDLLFWVIQSFSLHWLKSGTKEQNQEVIPLNFTFLYPNSAEEVSATFDSIRQRVASNNNLNMVGLAHQLDAFVNLSPGQAVISPVTMAATVEAIIGAVYLDSKSMHFVNAVLQTLGLTSSSSE